MPKSPWSAKISTVYQSESRADPNADLISVCIPLYNYGQFVQSCIASVARQSYGNIEIIVVDDASRDNSVSCALKALKKYEKNFVRVCLAKHDRNQGPALARNTAFDLSRGAHIFILDADNEIYPKAVEKLHSALERSNADAVYSQLEFFGNVRRLGYADLWDADELRRQNYVDVMALVTRRAWEIVDGFDHIESGWEDYDFWLKFVKNKLEPVYLPEILCRYRVHGNSRTYIDAHAAHEGLRSIMAFRHP